MKIIVMIAVLVFGGWGEGWGAPITSTCDSRPSWFDFQKALEQVLEQEKPIALPWEARCLIPQGGIPSATFGIILFRYLWSVGMWQHAAVFFGQPLSEAYQDQVKGLRVLCFEKFRSSCGRFLKYRERFLE